MTPEISEQFWQCVRKTDGCWYWLLTIQSGYGHFNYPWQGASRNMGAHRFAWMDTNQPALDKGHVLLNTCGTRGCVRPSHHERLERGMQGTRPVKKRRSA